MAFDLFFIHGPYLRSTFCGSLRPLYPRVKTRKSIHLENIDANELNLLFSKTVSEGLNCDKVYSFFFFPFFFFSSCTPIRGIYRKSLLRYLS